MATLLLFVLLFFSAALLVMVIYTIDRLNSVEKITTLLNTVVAPSPSISGVETPSMFEGLTGMVLWEAMREGGRRRREKGRRPGSRTP